MNAVEINQDYSSEYSPNISLDKEPNVNPTRFFKLMKVFDEPLWDSCVNYSKLSIIV